LKTLLEKILRFYFLIKRNCAQIEDLMKQLRSFARYYRPAIVPATPEADADLFLLESGHRMTDDNISE
jgi:hypothetical protein